MSDKDAATLRRELAELKRQRGLVETHPHWSSTAKKEALDRMDSDISDIEARLQEIGGSK